MVSERRGKPKLVVNIEISKDGDVRKRSLSQRLPSVLPQHSKVSVDGQTTGAGKAVHLECNILAQI
ncbi:hypothetical protein E2C01_016708 [Portunus trituberculatus]|uniref:Uncharacterized protein n=1 Tax=Portunus trituberculatus TaxID=210409 RepID=A0A5B7DRE5_PORTR|nr:hypothetical protein [Portunus trituberculatus]